MLEAQAEIPAALQLTGVAAEPQEHLAAGMAATAQTAIAPSAAKVAAGADQTLEPGPLAALAGTEVSPAAAVAVGQARQELVQRAAQAEMARRAA